jgi:hypothetical protein
MMPAKAGHVVRIAASYITANYQLYDANDLLYASDRTDPLYCWFSFISHLRCANPVHRAVDE